MRVWVAARHWVFRCRTRRRSSVLRAACGGLVFGGLLLLGRCLAGRAVHVGVAVLLGVCAQVAADLPAGHEPGLACFLVAAELDVGQVVIVGEVVRGPVRGLGAGSPVPVVGDGHCPAGAGGVRLGADVVPVAVAQVLQGQGPRHVGPVTVDGDALRLQFGGEGGLGFPLGPGGTELGGDVIELAGAAFGRLD